MKKDDNRVYRENPRNVKIKNAVIVLLTSVVLGLTGYGVVKEIKSNENNIPSGDIKPVVTTTPVPIPVNTPNSDNLYAEPIVTAAPIPTPLPTAEPTPVVTEFIADDGFNKGDSVRTRKSVNMRFGASVDTVKIGEVPKGVVIDRILSIDGFDLVRYDDKIAFVSEDFTVDDVEDYNNDYYRVTQENDVIRTTTEVYFRLGPSRQEKDICLLGKNVELNVIGISTNYSDPDDVWYLAKYNGKIGFVSAKYVQSLKATIKEKYPNVQNIELQKIGYLTQDTNLVDASGKRIKREKQYQTLKIMGGQDDYYMVDINGKLGLVPMANVISYKGVFVVVDLGDQRIYLYNGTDIAFVSPCTTGKNSTKTRTGAFTVYERTKTRYFSPGHEAKEMWANFDNGNGIHDADWEPEDKFGSEQYRRNGGSAGCVRLPTPSAKILKLYIKKGTNVHVQD